MKNKLLIFAGTTEGRLLAQELSNDFEITISVATDYGKEILEESKTNCFILKGRLNLQEMENLILEKNFDFIIDATHPYAIEVTKNIQKACENTKKEYVRFLRSDSQSNFQDENIKIFDSISEIVEFLSKTQIEGNIFVSTGSKEIKEFTKIPNFNEKIFVRVLPSLESISKCIESGISMSRIIAMQGPFSENLNEAMFKETNSKILVTKLSGKIGGTDEKISAAKKCNMQILAISRPSEKFENIFENINNLVTFLCKKCLF